MAKATRASDNTTSKKRTRKAAVNSEQANGNGTEVVGTATMSPEITEQAVQTMPVLEEKIRVRAYELYLQRHGKHGSPEQDWLQAAQEICGHPSARS